MNTLLVFCAVPTAAQAREIARQLVTEKLAACDEVPKIIAVDVAAGLPAYLEWVAGQTTV